MLVFWLLWIVVPVKCTTHPTHIVRTSLAIKRNIDKHHMNLGTKGFIDLLFKNDIIVDNTLFVKQIVNSYHDLMMILCPKRWGKTTNLDMLKTFLQIPVDEDGNRILPVNSTFAYAVFRRSLIQRGNKSERFRTPLLISKFFNFINKNLGQYPVIYVSFKHVFGNYFGVIRRRLHWAVSRAFFQHKYMLKVLHKGLMDGSIFKAEEKINTFKRALYNEKSSELEIIESLLFLCKILRNYFRKNVYVLIDDYDDPLHSVLQVEAFPKRDIMQVLRLVDNLVGRTMRANKFLRKGVVVGTYKFPTLRHKTKKQTDYRLYDITGRTYPMLQYFGFKVDDVQFLFHKFNLSDDIKQSANEWYRGMFASRRSNQHYYNPCSIINFLNRKEVASYWHENGNIDLMNKFLKASRTYRDEILTLLSRQNIYIGKRIELDEHDLWALKSLIHSDDLRNNSALAYRHHSYWDVHANYTTLFNAYLLEHGFMRYVFVCQTSDYYLAQLPNNEVAFEISRRMIYYIQQEYEIELRLLTNAASALLEFVSSDEKATKLENALEAIYNRSALNETHDDTAFGPENSEFMIFTGVTLEMQCLSKFEIIVYYLNIKDADMVMLNNKTKHGVVLEFKHHQDSPESVLKEAEKYTHAFDDQYPREQPLTVKYIGISVSRAKQVRIAARLRTREVHNLSTTLYYPRWELPWNEVLPNVSVDRFFNFSQSNESESQNSTTEKFFKFYDSNWDDVSYDAHYFDSKETTTRKPPRTTPHPRQAWWESYLNAKTQGLFGDSDSDSDYSDLEDTRFFNLEEPQHSEPEKWIYEESLDYSS